MADPATLETAKRSYYRARYYDPQTGRFLNEDQTGFDGGVNFFRYVNDSPTNLVDPFGVNAANPPITLPWPRTWPGVKPIPFPWAPVLGGVIGIILGDLAVPDSTSSTDTRRNDPLDCHRKDECKKQYTADNIWCELNFPDATDPMLWECYLIADENFERCLNGQPREDPDPRNKPVPKKPDDPKKPDPPIPFPKPRRPRP